MLSFSKKKLCVFVKQKNNQQNRKDITPKNNKNID